MTLDKIFIRDWLITRWKLRHDDDDGNNNNKHVQEYSTEIEKEKNIDDNREVNKETSSKSITSDLFHSTNGIPHRQDDTVNVNHYLNDVGSAELSKETSDKDITNNVFDNNIGVLYVQEDTTIITMKKKKSTKKQTVKVWRIAYLISVMIRFVEYILTIIKLIKLDLIGKTNKKEGYVTINDGTKRLKNRQKVAKRRVKWENGK